MCVWSLVWFGEIMGRTSLVWAASSTGDFLGGLSGARAVLGGRVGGVGLCPKLNFKFASVSFFSN